MPQVIIGQPEIEDDATAKRAAARTPGWEVKRKPSSDLWKVVGRTAGPALDRTMAGEAGREYQEAWGDVKDFGEYARTHMRSPGELGGAEAIRQAPQTARDVGIKPGGGPSKFAIPQHMLEVAKRELSRLPELFEPIEQTAKGLGGAMYLGTGIGPAAVGAAKSAYGHAAEKLGGDYEARKGDVDKALMAAGALGAARGGIRAFRGGRPLPPKPDIYEPRFFEPQGEVSSKWPVGPTKERIRAYEQQQRDILARHTQDFQHELSGVRIGQPQIFGRDRIEAAEVIKKAMRDRAAMEKRTERSQYRAAKKAGGEFRSVAFNDFADATRIDIYKNKGMRVDQTNTPAASEIIRFMEDTEKNLNTENDHLVSLPGGRLKGIALDEVEHIRQTMVKIGSSANTPRDQAAVGAIMKSFDARIHSFSQHPALYRGDKAAIHAWDLARDTSSKFKAVFRPGSTVGDIVSKIISSDSTGESISDFMWGAPGMNPSSKNILVMRTVKEKVGENSQAWIAGKQGLMDHLTNPKGEQLKPQQVAARIRQFFNSPDSRGMADLMFKPQEKSVALKLADLHDRAGVERMPQEQSVAKMITNRVVSSLTWRVSSALIGGGAGAALVTGGLKAAGAVAGAAVVAEGTREIRRYKQLKQLNAALPLITKELEKWQKAVFNAQRQNTRQARMIAYTKTAALSEMLRNKMGIDLGLQPAEAGDKLDLKRYGGPQQ